MTTPARDTAKRPEGAVNKLIRHDVERRSGRYALPNDELLDDVVESLGCSAFEAALQQATGDDSAYCNLCGKETSVSMISRHLVDEHGFDQEDIDNAPIVDSTREDDAEA